MVELHGEADLLPLILETKMRYRKAQSSVKVSLATYSADNDAASSSLSTMVEAGGSEAFAACCVVVYYRYLGPKHEHVLLRASLDGPKVEGCFSRVESGATAPSLRHGSVAIDYWIHN